ncbi:HAD hydrolase family protein [Pirellulales bacterium]|nr:HAD hydrolase family protein [Pirellulales bacterium]
MVMRDDLAKLCAPVRLLLTDVDGVLTDGGILLDNQGVESKRFSIRDGQGIRLWQEAGGQTGIVTGRSSQIVKLRAAELDFDAVRQGVGEKLPVVEEVARELGLEMHQVAYVGDDLPDLPVVAAVGLGASVADAAEELRQRADYVTTLPGGHGAVREVVELLLKSTGRWETAIRRFTA